MTNFVYKYGLMSILLVLWAMGITSYATVQIFRDIAAITPSAVSAYATLVGIPTIAVGVYKWRHERDL